MMSLRQCTLLPTKFANVLNFTQERRDQSYLSTTESEDAMSLRQCTLLPNKFANVILDLYFEVLESSATAIPFFLNETREVST